MAEFGRVTKTKLIFTYKTMRRITHTKTGCFMSTIIITCIVIYIYHYFGIMQNGRKSSQYFNFTQALQHRSSNDRFIILALVDKGFVDMALNLYYTSLLPHNIHNFLFVGAGNKSCDALHNHSLPCFVYTDIKDSDMASRYNTPSFIRKMNIRTEMIIEALSQGYTVLHTDLDVVFVKNPLPELKDIMQSADIAALYDDTAYNAGFLVIKPSSHGIEIYRRVKQITDISTSIDDQTALNRVITEMTYTHKKFRIFKLHPQRFACGREYFETGNRMFVGDRQCRNCSVIHNNWIVGREAKIYRFKEHHMWMVDRNQYYTNPSVTFLVYDNPIDYWKSEESNTIVELHALKAALAIGQITGRVVILPRFHCGERSFIGTDIPLNSAVNPRILYKSYNNTRTMFESGVGTAYMRKVPDVRPDSSEDNRTRAGSGKSSSIGKRLRECPLNGLLDMTVFDRELSGLYRESSFLTHPLVDIPPSLYSKPQLILTSLAKNFSNTIRISHFRKDQEIFEPKSLNDDGVISETEIRNRYGWQTTGKSLDKADNKDARVLMFHSLYGVKINFTNPDVNREFEVKIKKAFKRNNYRQP